MTSVNDIVIETDKLKIEKIQLDEQGNLTADYSFEDKTYTVKMTSDEITQMSSELESKFVQPEDQDTFDENERNKEEEEEEKKENDKYEKERKNRRQTGEDKEKARKMEFLKNICDVDTEAFDDKLITNLTSYLLSLVEFLSKETTETITVEGKKNISEAVDDDLKELINGIPEYKEKKDKITKKIEQNNNEIKNRQPVKAAGGEDNSEPTDELVNENIKLNKEVENYTSDASINKIKKNNLDHIAEDSIKQAIRKKYSLPNENEYKFFPNKFPIDSINQSTPDQTSTQSQDLSIPKYLKDNVIEKDFEHTFNNSKTISTDPFYTHVKYNLPALMKSGMTKSPEDYTKYYNSIVGQDKLIHSSIMILGNLMKLIQGLELYNTLLKNKHFENIKVSRISIQDDANKPRGLSMNTNIFSSTPKQKAIKSIMVSANNINYSIQQINDAINEIKIYSKRFTENINGIIKSEYTNGYFFQAFEKTGEKMIEEMLEKNRSLVNDLQGIHKKTRETATYINPIKGEKKLTNITEIPTDIPLVDNVDNDTNATCEEAIHFKSEEPKKKGLFYGGNKHSRKKKYNPNNKATMRRKLR